MIPGKITSPAEISWQEIGHGSAEILQRQCPAPVGIRGQIPPFDKLNPTSENIAMHIYKVLSSKLDDGNVKVYRVRVGENHTSGASYFEE